MELLDPIQLREVDSRDRLKYMTGFLICRLVHVLICVVGITSLGWNHWVMYCSALGTAFHALAVYLAWRWDVSTSRCVPSCISPAGIMAMAVVIDAGLMAMTRVDVQRAIAVSVNLNNTDQVFGSIADMKCSGYINMTRRCQIVLHWQAQSTTQIFQFVLFYFMVFVLKDPQASPVGGLCVFVYSAISLSASFVPEVGVNWMSRHDLHILVPAYAISVIAKYKMARSKDLLIAVLEKQKENVVQEKVLRCQAEFTCEQLACQAAANPMVRGAQDAAAYADLDKTATTVSEVLLTSDDGDVTLTSSYPETATDSALIFKDLAKELSQNQLARIAALAVREHWHIPSKDLKLESEQVLGSGGFGIVYGASYLGTPAAVKVSKILQAQSLSALVNELRILRRIRHPNIVLFYGACIDALMLSVALVLEEVKGERLDHFCAASMHRCSVAHSCHIVNCICRAICYLHSQCPAIVHGDLKPSNIMVHSEGSSARPHIKLLDFGLSRLLTKSVESLGGTVAWMAPEVLGRQSQIPKPSADVFSIGRISYFVFVGKSPVAHLSHQSLREMAVKGVVPPLEWPESEELLEFRITVDRCMEFQADCRPTIFEVHAASSLLALQVSDGAALGIPRKLSNKVKPDPVPDVCGDRVKCHLKPTSFEAKSVSIAEAIQHWNVAFRRESFCCAWHAALQELQFHAQHLMRESCWQNFPPSFRWQCKDCGLLHDDTYCYICEPRNESSSLAAFARAPLISL